MKSSAGNEDRVDTSKSATKVAAPLAEKSVRTPTKPKLVSAKAAATPLAQVNHASASSIDKDRSKSQSKSSSPKGGDAVKNPVNKSSGKTVTTSSAQIEKSSMSTSPTSTKVASVATASVPAKAGRPSSRLAQLTVPSMAQTVASTAAKASYTQTLPEPVIVPVMPSAIKKDPALADNWKTKPLDQLTDADLLSMPDTEYMNDVQMAAFRLKLVTLKRDILSNAGETTEHLREDTSVTPDPADRATIEEEHALELRTRDRERKLLKKIEQSIARIDSGDYGYCDETGEPIGVGRLLARPTATLSLEAQQRRELKQKMFGD